MILICQQCSKEFSTTDRDRKYCSRKCYGLTKLKPPPKYVCKKCGKTFPDPNYNPTRVFCSKACMDSWQPANRPVLTCRNCKKQFTTSRGHKIKPLYCSRKCYSEDRYASAAKYYCVQCGKEFTSSNRHPRFCSIACVRRYEGFTSIELVIKNVLESIGVIFIPEYALGVYAFDFCVPSAHLLIECDGTYWHSSSESKNRDRRKNKFAATQGYRVLRLPQSIIEKDIYTCRQSIIKELV